jgi:ATP-dependent RNA helicase DDX18/HAS1
VGRTARAGGRGKALLFLLPSELGFLRFLKQAKIPLNEYQFPPTKIANVQSQLERLVEKNYYLNKSAKDGYRSYLQAYASHSLKQIFNVESLDLQKVAKAYGFSVPPSVNLLIGASGKSSFSSRKSRPLSNKSAPEGTGRKNGKKEYIKKQVYSGKSNADGRQWSR